MFPFGTLDGSAGVRDSRTGALFPVTFTVLFDRKLALAICGAKAAS